jgi:hypothetical protein
MRHIAVAVTTVFWVGIALSPFVGGCGSQTDSPSATPTGPSQSSGVRTGVIEGIVRAPFYGFCRLCDPNPPLAGASVTVIEGRAAGTTTMTDNAGHYRLELPDGDVRLRISGPDRYLPQDGPLKTVTGAATTTMPDLLLQWRPWALSGVVIDPSARPVGGAQVVFRDTGIDSSAVARTVITDANGVYRFAGGSSGHADVLAGAALKEGFTASSVQMVPCCKIDGDTVANFTVGTQVITSISLVKLSLGPSNSLTPGERAPIGADVKIGGLEFVTSPYELRTSDSRVIAVLPPLFLNGILQSIQIQAVNPGDATISWVERNSPSTSLQIHVQ